MATIVAKPHPASCRATRAARQHRCCCSRVHARDARRSTLARASAQKDVDAADANNPWGFTAKYHAAMTMAELYVLERPAAVPVEEHVARRRKRDTQEIIEAAKRRGKSEAYVQERVAQLNALAPDLINLHKMKAADWVTVLADVDAVAAKLISIKAVFPGASAFKVVTKLPKILLLKTEAVQADAEKVRQLLSSLPNPDAVIDAVPDLVQPAALLRALASIKAAMPSQQPLQVLQATPEVLYSLGGEADMEDSAEYGELSTKD